MSSATESLSFGPGFKEQMLALMLFGVSQLRTLNKQSFVLTGLQQHNNRPWGNDYNIIKDFF